MRDLRQRARLTVEQLEGYLRARAEVGAARGDGEALADRMPWLTTAQREELVRLYTEDRIDLTRSTLGALTRRCRELRAEYEARYARLRRLLLTVTVAVLLGALALTSAAAALLLPGTG
ncbi:hypothetical protein [Streptomyces aidingensis]|uniref:Uncharacterized protein n=1 Tax=Streptomyces aidingensis TaxID=910347 RepID=A0A1I1EK06_9ACTN|nr:hypothetical protein [Streptomyces aidingensis]SFB87401.1 hypothetical protein SAMN05421773_101340 [Streptomyces aidingensis]